MPFLKIAQLNVILVLILAGCAPSEVIQPTANIIPTSLPVVSADTLIPTTETLTIPIPIGLPPTSSAPPTATSSHISVQDKAVFVSETFPDQSILKTGEKFTKSWEIKNTGTSTWTTAYQIVMSAAPQGETFGSPAQVHFTQETKPGALLKVSIPLVAPSKAGIYTVFWSIKNGQGETVAVNGGNLWAQIQVCDPNQPCYPPATQDRASAIVDGVTVTVIRFASDEKNTAVYYCISIPNLPPYPQNKPLRDYSSSIPTLLVDQKQPPWTGVGQSDFAEGDGCSFLQYQLSSDEAKNAQHVVLSIDSITRGGPVGGHEDESCQADRLKLIAKYPGLDFVCHFSMGGYFTNLKPPQNMTYDKAYKIVVDTISDTHYGPWNVVIK